MGEKIQKTSWKKTLIENLSNEKLDHDESRLCKNNFERHSSISKYHLELRDQHV